MHLVALLPWLPTFCNRKNWNVISWQMLTNTKENIKRTVEINNKINILGYTEACIHYLGFWKSKSIFRFTSEQSMTQKDSITLQNYETSRILSWFYPHGSKLSYTHPKLLSKDQDSNSIQFCGHILLRLTRHFSHHRTRRFLSQYYYVWLSCHWLEIFKNALCSSHDGIVDRSTKYLSPALPNKLYYRRFLAEL